MHSFYKFFNLLICLIIAENFNILPFSCSYIQKLSPSVVLLIATVKAMPTRRKYCSPKRNSEVPDIHEDLVICFLLSQVVRGKFENRVIYISQIILPFISLSHLHLLHRFDKLQYYKLLHEMVFVPPILLQLQAGAHLGFFSRQSKLYDVIDDVKRDDVI